MEADRVSAGNERRYQLSSVATHRDLIRGQIFRGACLLWQFWLKGLVLFSCKIIHSVITFMDRRGEDLEVLYEKCDWPAEFLRDPSCWLEADKMENLLRQIDQDYGRSYQNDESLIETVGHQCKDLRSWGVLDSVLRMVQAPKDLFAQPERFLSYFVSPAPPVGEVRRGADFVSFVLPVSEEQFPHVTAYLRAALEALPTYINKPMATVRWDNSRVMISWSEQQASLFGEAQNTELSLHPELVRSILMNLESSQKQLDEMKKEVLAKDQEIEELKKRLETASIDGIRDFGGDDSGEINKNDLRLDLRHLTRGLDHEIAAPLGAVLSELYRVGDYMARGHQLVTLLVGQGRQTPQVQEAMRRVDWPFVSAEGPKVIRRSVQLLQGIQKTIQDLHLLAKTRSESLHNYDEIKTPSDLNDIVGRAIKTVKAVGGHDVNIDQHLLLDRQVPVNPSRIEQAVVNLLSNAVEALQPGGVVRVVTRPKGQRAEIEISDTGRGMDAPTLARAPEPFFTTKSDPSSGLGLSVAQSIVKMHEGFLHIQSQPGRGSTVVVDLPLTN